MHCLLNCSHCIQFIRTVTSLHSLFIMKNIVHCVHSVHTCYSQSVVNILFVVHCLLVLNNFFEFVVNSLPVAYEWLVWHIYFV